MNCIVDASCGQHLGNEIVLQLNYHKFQVGLSEHSQPEKTEVYKT